MAFQDRIAYHSNNIIQTIIFVIGLISTLITFYTFHLKPLTFQADFFLFGFSIATLVFLALQWWSYTPFFLLSTFTMIVTWRLAALAQYELVSYIYLFAFVFIVIQFLITCANDSKDQLQGRSGIHISSYEWQLLFVRMYLGYDLIPHFCEKLLAGGAIRAEDVGAFIHLGVPHAFVFVILAGFIELAGALSISCGFITRLGAMGTWLYLMIASYLGHHFSLGFIWANPGGGWEYPVLWAALILSFAWTGANTFSIDEVLNENLKLPKWLKWLIGVRQKI